MPGTRTTRRLQAAAAADVQEAARLLRAGGLVAFATETVYGLGANALDERAVAGIFAAKQRPAWDPLIVHLADGNADQLARVARVSGGLTAVVDRLAEAFWPGPLTLLLPRAAATSDAVTAGRGLVGVRVPALASARALLRLADVPVAAPSANRFGHTSPTTAEHVLADLDGRIDAVLDDGACAVGVESTVFNPMARVVYRPGGVSVERLSDVLGEPVSLFVPDERAAAAASLPSPGVGIRHYAPGVPLVLCASSEAGLREAVATHRRAGRRVGVLLPQGWLVDADAVFAWAAIDDAEGMARTVFAGLRTLEASGVDAIVCPLPAAGGLGDALRDRLEKAARAR